MKEMLIFLITSDPSDREQEERQIFENRIKFISFLCSTQRPFSYLGYLSYRLNDFSILFYSVKYLVINILL